MMKIGDWCRPNGSEDRYLVFGVVGNRVGLVDEGGGARFGTADNYTPLPQCTGWHWKPVEPGEGYRLIDITTEKPQEGDEYYSLDFGWRSKPGPYSGAEFNQKYTYRRKVEPQYRPFATGREFETHRYRWIAGDGTTQRAFSYGDNGVNGNDFESLFLRFKFINEDGTTEPCGVMV